MNIIVDWNNYNYGASEHRVYRDTVSMDPNNLPTPHQTLVPEISEYVDVGVTEGQTYYYIVSTMVNGVEYKADQISILADSPFVAAANLIAAFDFEDLSGGTVKNLVGANEALPYYGATAAIGPDSSQALEFDGSDWVDLRQLNALLLGNAGSVAFWARVDSAGPIRAFAKYKNSSPYSFFGISIQSDGQATLFYRSATVSYTEIRAPVSNFTNGSWHHYVFTGDGTTNKAYVDGAEVAFATTTGEANQGRWFDDISDLDYTVMSRLRSGSSTTYYGEGAVDHYYIYDRVLTASEVTELYQKVGPL